MSNFWEVHPWGRSRRGRDAGTRSVVAATLRRCAPLRTGRHRLASRRLSDVILHSPQTHRESAKLQPWGMG